MRDPVHEIEARVLKMRAHSPYLPIAVVVPSHLLGTWLAHSLFEDTGHLAISFPLLHELAWQVVEARLARGLTRPRASTSRSPGRRTEAKGPGTPRI
jgi:hypothetical protein